MRWSPPPIRPSPRRSALQTGALWLLIGCSGEQAAPTPPPEAPAQAPAAPDTTPPSTAPTTATETPTATATETTPTTATEPSPTGPTPTASNSTVATPTASTPAAPATAVAAPAASPASAPATTTASEAAPAVAAPEAAPSAVTYTFNTGASALYVQVFKDPDTMGAGLSHDHVVVARNWTGTATWHPTEPSQCAVKISVPVAKLEVDPPAMRKKVGYDTELSSGQRDDVRKNMLARDQLNGDEHSTISFTSRSCSATSGAVTVEGDLNLLGQTRPLSIKATVKLGEGTFSAKGGFSIQGSDWGLSPFKAMMGALKNQDKLKFSFDLAGKAG